MNASSLALFLHIVGALGFFAAMGLEWTGLREIRSATLPAQVRSWLGIVKNASQLAMPFMLTLVITGFYMVMTDVGWVAWILVVLGALVFGMALSLAVSRPRLAALGQALSMERESLSGSFHKLANQPLLWISVQVRIMLGLGIVFLKIAQPDLGMSLLVIGVSVVLGLASAWSVNRPLRAGQPSTD